MKHTKLPARTYSVEEAAALIGVSRSLLYRQAAQGDLPAGMGAIRIGTTTRFPKAAIDRLVGTDEEAA